ncbi:MAG: hypothetical protein QXM31_01580 [Candidatus Woesearchaeota archaeon]
MGKKYLVVRREPGLYQLCKEMPEQMQAESIVSNGTRYYAKGKEYDGVTALLYRLQTARHKGDEVTGMGRRLAYIVEHAEELLKRRRERKAQNAGSRLITDPAAPPSK